MLNPSEHAVPPRQDDERPQVFARDGLFGCELPYIILRYSPGHLMRRLQPVVDALRCKAVRLDGRAPSQPSPPTCLDFVRGPGKSASQAKLNDYVRSALVPGVCICQAKERGQDEGADRDDQGCDSRGHSTTLTGAPVSAAGRCRPWLDRRRSAAGRWGAAAARVLAQCGSRGVPRTVRGMSGDSAL